MPSLPGVFDEEVSMRSSASRPRIAALLLALSPFMSAQQAPLQFVTYNDDTTKSDALQRVADKPASPVRDPRGLVRPPVIPLGQGYGGEVEPNGTTATATPIVGTNVV